ncbi:MAG: plasmid pRiA4b ORF-3 family protein [Gammaproteobacteria bacterium]|nr:plasmid pRiA4b ORF-3 family protein [Gammaproteobacteria bacterium]
MHIYQIKITLKHSRPPIWRRIQVSGDTKLRKLHDILQVAMGWTDSHLHAFLAGGMDYGMPDPEFPGDMKNERNVRLDRIADEGDTLIYEYDFGDGWEHELKVEKVMPAAPGAHYPICLAGKRACPPEDCSGIPGYEHLLDVLGNPDDEEHADMRDWLGEELDPEAFDLKEVNDALQEIR